VWSKVLRDGRGWALSDLPAAGSLAGGIEAPEATVGDAVNAGSAHRLEHYELVIAEDGQPVELGRGAMGVTYKAVDLQCPVTLKGISEKYLGDEAARARFCVRHVRRRVCVIPMLPPSSTSGGKGATTDKIRTPK
jgi:hypothetical protein